MKTISILFITVLFLFASCNGENSNQSSAAQQPVAPVYDNTLATGKVTDSIICKNDPNQSYALYLPTGYSPGKKFPCIYLFDAHARGVLPVSMYKNLAEKYGFVLIGSDVSKNGMQWQQTNEAVKTLMDDTRTRINIDTQRIFTGGFSGGSRVAASIAILDGGVAGVIGCAAGFPRVDQGIQNKFNFFGMVGDYDFNFTEMAQLDKTLEQNGFAHQLLTFEGKHDWPTPADMETAMLWIQVNAMKENLQPKNDTLITAFRNDFEQRITAASSGGDRITEYDITDGLVRALSGLSDISSYKKQLAGLVNSAAYKNAVTEQGQLQQMEFSGQQELQQQFAAQDEKWRIKKITALNQNIVKAKTKQASQMYRRLLSFTGLEGYLNCSHALSTGNLPTAESYLKTFKMADPQNPDCSYLAAIYYMKKGNPQQAVSALNDAASSGYNDVSQLITDSAFSSLQHDVAFKKVISRARENMLK